MHQQHGTGDEGQHIDHLAQGHHDQRGVRGPVRAEDEFEGQQGQGGEEIEGVTVEVVQVDEEVARCLVEGLTGGEHADGVRVLGVFVDLEYGEHLRLARAGQVGGDEGGEIDGADDEQDAEGFFLCLVHRFMFLCEGVDGFCGGS